MNNKEFIIGEMINDDLVRVSHCKWINDEFLKDEKMIKLLPYLKEKEFSFEKVLLNEGKDLLAYAMNLSIESMKIKVRNRCVA